MKKIEKRIILGSASPRRRELLSQIGVDFEVKVSNKEEIYTSDIPEEIVKELALMKAENVASEMEEEKADAAASSGTAGAEAADADGAAGGRLRDTVIIGADTIVVLDDKILGKPADEKDAARMLRNLQGRCHEVYTGVAMLDYDSRGEKRTTVHAVGTKVYVNPMTKEEIDSYIAAGEPMDKAGAYGIQGRFAAYIDRIDGDYYNVVGLPVSYVYGELAKAEEETELPR